MFARTSLPLRAIITESISRGHDIFPVFLKVDGHRAATDLAIVVHCTRKLREGGGGYLEFLEASGALDRDGVHAGRNQLQPGHAMILGAWASDSVSIPEDEGS